MLMESIFHLLLQLFLAFCRFLLPYGSFQLGVHEFVPVSSAE